MIRSTAALFASLLLAACAVAPPGPPPPPPPPAAPPVADTTPDFAVLWVRGAAEFEALALQAYTEADDDLPRLLADREFTALPGRTGVANLPPAIIADVDQTLVDNVEFQLAYEPPFSDAKFDAWNRDNPSAPVPGAPGFVERARAAGVTVFFVTNRACAPLEGSSGACPQEQITLDDLRGAGIPADAEHLLLANEKPEWTQEKERRRDLIAERYRVIMLFGDDLGDFLPCVRTRVLEPCTRSATADSRRAQTRESGALWGNGWYMLPNPMYGSWTSAL